MRRRDDAHVDRRSAALPPTRSKLALLQHAQHLGLRLGRHVADLVEEDRAAVAPPRTGRARRASAPVKAPFSWPNSSLSTSSRLIAAQFTATNGRSPARAALVERLRDQLLARAALAAHQHGEIGLGDLAGPSRRRAASRRPSRSGSRSRTRARRARAAGGSRARGACARARARTTRRISSLSKGFGT